MIASTIEMLLFLHVCIHGFSVFFFKTALKALLLFPFYSQCILEKECHISGNYYFKVCDKKCFESVILISDICRLLDILFVFHSKRI